MKELIEKISLIPDVYDDFIFGVVNYAKRKPQNIKAVSDFIDRNKNVTTSDVVEFIAEQPDFNEYNNIGEKEKVG